MLIGHLRKHSLSALKPELVADFRDTRLSTIVHCGQPISANTVRLDLAGPSQEFGYLYTVAIQ
ncbi:hypothetical protein OM427_04780 [Halomonas sp. 18H]|nr:hypothetical protein [Halomonas sp. 18H]MCW4148847.1 hypothetical protein [Halomonas sp. 18H]